MIQSIDDYYNDVMTQGTGPAKILMTEEALMAGTMANKLVQMTLPPHAALDEEQRYAKALNFQRELLCLLHAHRGMVLANFLMERAEGHPMTYEGPVVVPTAGDDDKGK